MLGELAAPQPWRSEGSHLLCGESSASLGGSPICSGKQGHLLWGGVPRLAYGPTRCDHAQRRSFPSALRALLVLEQGLRLPHAQRVTGRRPGLRGRGLRGRGSAWAGARGLPPTSRRAQGSPWPVHGEQNSPHFRCCARIAACLPDSRPAENKCPFFCQGGKGGWTLAC